METSQFRGIKKVLRLGLISCPCKLVNAIKPIEHFTLMSKCHNAKLENIRKCSSCQNIVSYENTSKAVKITKDINVILDSKEIERVKGQQQEATDINVISVVNNCPVPSEKSYWVIPEKLFEVYACLVKVLSEQNKRLFASVVLRKGGRNTLLSIGSDGLRLKADVLVTAERCIQPPTLAPTISVKESDVAILSKYLETMQGEIAIEDVTNHEAEKLLSVVEAKLSGQKPIITTSAVMVEQKKELDTFELLAKAMGE